MHAWPGIKRGRRGSFFVETKQEGPARNKTRVYEMEGCAMKKLLTLAVLLSLGMFTLGCEKKKDAPADAPPPADTPADAPADGG
jgi:hypothetical protein